MITKEQALLDYKDNDEVEEYAIHDPNDEYKLSFMKQKRAPIKNVETMNY